MSVEDYCDSEDFMRQLDPRVLYDKNDPGRQERVERRMEEYENAAKLLVEQDIEYISRRVDGTRMFDHFWMNRQMPSTSVHYFTTFSHLKDYCKTRFPTKNQDYCALAHINEKGNIDAIPH